MVGITGFVTKLLTASGIEPTTHLPYPKVARRHGKSPNEQWPNLKKSKTKKNHNFIQGYGINILCLQRAAVPVFSSGLFFR